jgi:YaiO family outer membrane protein
MGQELIMIIALACGASGIAPDAMAQPLCPSAEVRGDGQIPAPPVTDQAPSGKKTAKDVFYSVTIGAGFSPDYPDGEFFRFAAWKPNKQGVTLDVGEQHAGGESSLAGSVSYWRSLDPKTTITFSGGGGTAPFAPRFGLGASISRPILTLGVNAGAGYREWADGAWLTEVGVGAVRWLPHWIVGGGVTYSRGEPTNFAGWRGGVGLTYFIWRKTYASIGVDFGKGDNRDWNYVTRSKGLNYGFSQWFNGNSGISVAAGQSLDNDTYGVSVSWFKEW